MKKTWSGLLVALLVCAVCPLFAGPIIIGGDITLVAPPASLQTGLFESNTEARGFGEKTAFTLTGPLVLDFGVPGTYGSSSALTPTTLSAGMVINSYYLHMDPSSGTPTYGGNVTFLSERILGFIVTDASLTASNGLGVLITYPSSPAGYGLAPATPGNSLTFDSNSFSFSLTPFSASDADNLRIITENTSIPEPATGLLLLPGLLALGLLRRRKRAAR